jgi:hypothetical protein
MMVHSSHVQEDYSAFGSLAEAPQAPMHGARAWQGHSKVTQRTSLSLTHNLMMLLAGTHCLRKLK